MPDDDFVEQVYHASYRRLVGQFFLICGGDLAAAEDIVSEAFVRAVAARARISADSESEAGHRQRRPPIPCAIAGSETIRASVAL